MSTRRSVRFFDARPVPTQLLRDAIMAAGTAPSGAHLQPWTFVVVRNPDAKTKLREHVEAAEAENYESRMSKKWVKDVSPIVGSIHKSGVQKPYLTEAPAIIVVMEHKWQVDDNGNKQSTYYSVESCGIAAGMLIAALHNANLTTVTTTPLGAGESIRLLLQRPENERVLFLMPVGYPSEDCTVPYRPPGKERKQLSDIMVEF